MFVKKTGFPEEDDIVICTVTAVQHHSVFARLDEYNKGGLIHISEVSPGRIRNIRDYVKEGKVVVCKVLRVNQEKGHIDLSLRRVNESQRRAKLEEIKKEQFAEKIVGGIGKQFKVSGEALYKKIWETVGKEYDTLYPYLEGVMDGSEDLSKLDIDDKIVKALEETVKEKIKPPTVHISGKFVIRSYDPKGVELIKESLVSACKDDTVTLDYAGAGIYRIKVTSGDFKDAEKRLDKTVNLVSNNLAKYNIAVQFERVEA
jgi:translation initiation factor 2 subunit 1